MYAQVAEDLRAKITSGELSEGARLPTEAQLVDEYGSARGTIRQALALLASEGLIQSAGTRGHFVRGDHRYRYRPQAEWRPQPRYPEADRWMEDTRDRNPTQLINVEIATPPEVVRERLQLDPGDLVAIRRRVRSLDGQPWNTNDSYYPLSVVQGSEIMNPTDIPRGTNQVLTDLGYEQVRCIDEIEARPCTPEESDRLDLAPGTPVALLRVTGYTEDNRPVRCTLNVLPGTRHVLTYERTKQP
jgi:DNA-binding GntR family transcriptional regulator